MLTMPSASGLATAGGPTAVHGAAARMILDRNRPPTASSLRKWANVGPSSFWRMASILLSLAALLSAIGRIDTFIVSDHSIRSSNMAFARELSQIATSSSKTILSTVFLAAESSGFSWVLAKVTKTVPCVQPDRGSHCNHQIDGQSSDSDSPVCQTVTVQ